MPRIGHELASSCVCVCVCERERERERELASLLANTHVLEASLPRIFAILKCVCHLCVCVCVHVCVCVCV